MRAWIVRFIARRVNDEIVMESQEKAENYRWAFSNITENAFNWRNEFEFRPGKWRLEQRFTARRNG